MSEPRHDDLRAAFQSLSRDATFTSQCPPADRLWAGARGELARHDVEHLATHLAECGACAEAWRIARDFGTPAALPAPKAAAVTPWWLAAAAVIGLAAGLSLLYYTRTPDPAAPVASAPVVAPSFAIPIEKAPIKVSSRYALTWRGPGDGQRFMSDLKIALEPYERGDYAAAVQTLSALRKQYADTAETSLYLGISMLLAGSGNPIEVLEHARNLAEPGQAEDAAWFLAAAYERGGRRADAQRMAQTVCDAKGPRATHACSAAAALGDAR
jgi:hypothetical protein